ncbi:peptidyl-alpha-hydroxyglycine alpha-amidating lyase family protein [Caldovatus aquaticus]|uniref:Peptidyl-alpha-hydroxyglycine alpha-amidating lyase family protein n=1 Tax=Caldovatus aquaticus TaxID=2865671 RepID=A0ABS7F493_9PROT|nr:peptidyl-alpha-hydroxyglycine alpha-amidating lyase family protein [Caldovatus aquaticus]MBW8270429.1 peptidyl-alpha-hydroxyglycine alpha-amidating lyase family protein [Caldovatus aquaticus]
MTATVLGQGEYRYEPVAGWGRVPEGLRLGEVAAVAADSRDRVYAFNRGPHPMVVFDRDGTFLASWGEGLFRRPHGLHIGPDDALWCTDDGDHTVRKCTPDGRVLLTIGIPGRPAPSMSGQPFNRCTHTALSPEGDLYVSDGYGNACVHKFSPEGRHLFSWGRPGTDPGEFNLPHNIACDADGWVYVADRENHRIQIFDGNGRYETQWNNLHRPCALFLGKGRCPVCYVGELGSGLDVNLRTPNVGPRISILSHEGRRLSRFGELGEALGQFIAPHGLAVDSQGDLYVGEVAVTAWPRYHDGRPAPAAGVRSLQKFRRVPAG